MTETPVLSAMWILIGGNDTISRGGGGGGGGGGGTTKPILTK